MKMWRLILSVFTNMIQAKRKFDLTAWNIVDRYVHLHSGWALYLMARWHEEDGNDYMQALTLFVEAAEQGCAKSRSMVGHLHITKVKPRNIQLAVYWFKKAIVADAHMADAFFALGCICSEGYDIADYDEYEACDFWKKAALDGHEPAQQRLRKIGITDAKYFPPVNQKHILV